MPEFKRPQIQFVCLGVSVGRPLDELPPGKYRQLLNVRTYQEGRIEPRPGLQHIATPSASDIVSIKRLNNYDGSASARFVSTVAGVVYTGLTSFTQRDTAYSGRPLSLIPFRPEAASSAWMYIGDSDKIRKISAAGVDNRIGLRPPAAPAVALSGAGGLTGDYKYRIRGRNSVTGAKSNPSAESAELTASSQGISVTPPAQSTDDDLFDVFRYGGSLTSWLYVGTASPSTALIDNQSDSAIASNELLSFDNYQPFLSIDNYTSGAVTVAGTAVTWSSGDKFNVDWVPGTTITIGGRTYTLAAHPSTTEALTLTASGAANGAYNVIAATTDAQPLPHMWGPFGGGQFGEVMFACGDPNLPGTLKWTNGNDPDTQGITNSLEITSPSEPLVNGCIYDGRAYVWTSERMFAIYPDFSTPGQFSAQVIPNSKGLFAPWAFAVGPKLWFLARDGIYETEGGNPRSITKEDLNPIFRHESQAGVSTGELVPPNFSDAINLRLSYYNNYLYFDYLDTNTDATTLVYDTRTGAWFVDSYNPGTTTATSLVHYGEEGVGSLDTVEREAYDTVLLAVGNALYQQAGVEDDGNTVSCEIFTGYEHFGDARADKLISEIQTDTDARGVTVTLLAKANLGAIASLATTTISQVGRAKQLLNVNSGLGTLARNVSLEISWASDSATPKFYEWSPAFVPKPEDTDIRATDWTDDGYTGAKYLRGVVIEADTENVEKTVEVQRDGGTVVATLAITHNGQLEKPYVFTPAVGHEFRLNPTDADTWKQFKVRWIYDRYPENAAILDDFDDDGYTGEKYVRGLVIEADTSNGAVSFQVQHDGGTVASTPSITHNGRDESPVAFTTPFLAHTLRVVPLAAWRKFSVRWIYDKYPELSQILSPWDDAGKPGPKYVRGLTITADTVNAGVSVQVQKDGGSVAATITATHDGQEQITYSFDTPFVAYMLRLVPQANWRFFRVAWIADPWPDLDNLVTAWEDGGHSGAKFIRGVVLDADTADVEISVQVEKDEEVLAATITGVDHDGRGRVPYDFTSPFVANLLRLKPQANWRYWGAQWIFDPYPELERIISEWTEAGTPGAKYVQGMRLIADSANVGVPLEIEYDGGTTGANVTATHNGKVSIPYSWTPFVAHTLRLVPTGNIRIFEPPHWVFEPMPELATVWTTQPTTHDLPGYGHLRDGYIAHMSTSNVTLTVTADGVAQSGITIAHGTGAYKKTYVKFPAVKAKYWEYSLTSAAGLRLFVKDCEIRVKAWGQPETYIVKNPFGDVSRERGATI